MGTLKRWTLFILTNIAVVVTISIILTLLGVRGYFDQNGINFNSLLVFCLVWGMVGSFISLQLSRWMAKTMMGVRVIDPNNQGQYAGLYQMVAQLSRAAGLAQVPEVGVFDSPEMNAFATGPSKSRALVAFSSGLLSRMKRDEIEGVAAHEIAHIANGDMVTMALLQGVINAFVMFLSRVIAFAITVRGGEDRDRPSMLTYILIPILEIVFSFLGMIVVGYFSRKREFRADADSARLAGRQKMIAALEALRAAFGNPVTAPQTVNGLDSMKISGKQGGFISLFSTHPPLEVRIEALKKMQF
jgi:heat shock protein HtpX